MITPLVQDKTNRGGLYYGVRGEENEKVIVYSSMVSVNALVSFYLSLFLFFFAGDFLYKWRLKYFPQTLPQPPP